MNAFRILRPGLLILAVFHVTVLSAADTLAPAPKDSASQRLEAFRDVVSAALKNLPGNQGDDPTGGFQQIIADLNSALENVTKGLEYVKAHPEAEALLTRPVRGGWPATHRQFSSGTSLLFDGVHTNSQYGSTLDHLTDGLDHFLIGDSVNGYCVLGEIGGFRDKILRCTDTARRELNNEIIYLQNSGNAGSNSSLSNPTALAVAPVGQEGSLSGTVLNAHDCPAAFAAISFAVAGELFPSTLDHFRNPPKPTTGPRVVPPIVVNGVLSTVADAEGKFTIHDLPPGEYVVSAYLTNGAERQTGTSPPVEVKAGEDANLPRDIMLEASPDLRAEDILFD